MPTIRLNNGEWTFDEGQRLGPPGGFGEVFVGAGSSGAVAVKRLNLTAGHAAHRELSIGAFLSSRTLKHIVPVFDAGQDADSDRYYLVMPICEGSLQDRLQTQGPLPPAEARQTIIEILAGLHEAGDIVHRDLKPGNVLRLDGSWRLADFGIAKFVEDSTSLLTLRNALTPAYAAPEQWRTERASHATDVYALGCIAYTLYSGQPPFAGSDDVRKAHLEAPTPSLPQAGPRLAAFVTQMLRKSPASRPTLQRCSEVFQDSDGADQRPHHAGLLAAAGQVAEAASLAEAAREAEAAQVRDKQEQVREAAREMVAMRERLIHAVRAVSDEAVVTGLGVKFGEGTLEWSDATPLPERVGPNPHESGWTILAGTAISVSRAPRQSKPRPAFGRDDTQYAFSQRAYIIEQGRGFNWSASIVFAVTPADQNYRWREVAFWSLSGGRYSGPRALDPAGQDFNYALSNVMHTWNVAFGPVPIDGEDEPAFQHRWLTLLSRAATGQLDSPNQMPIPPGFFD